MVSPFSSSASWHNQGVVWCSLGAQSPLPAGLLRRNLGWAGLGCTAVWSVVARRSLHCSASLHSAITAGHNSNQEISFGIVIQALDTRSTLTKCVVCCLLCVACCLLSAVCCLRTRGPAPPPAPAPLHYWPGLLSPNWTDAGAHYWPGWLHCNSNLFHSGRHTTTAMLPGNRPVSRATGVRARPCPALSSRSAGSVSSQCYLCCGAAVFVY